ncbi:hypothetical protein KAI04_02670 [Candidatus Pacearchaeota archaeon]|nr:hypothetical protein [Candidatus Pacearchaeota archaeon]
MKKLILILFMALIFILFVSGIKINEIEMNPSGTDAGNEWIELYGGEEINLEGYKLINNDGDEIILNGIFSGYYVYVLDKQWLDNLDEKVFLYKNENLIDESGIFDDSYNNDKTWQLCNSWKFLEATKGEKNRCETEESEEKITDEQVEDVEENIKEYVEKEKEEFNIPLTPEVISLTPKDIKSEENTESLDKTDYARYGFIGFCILIGVLLILKNKRKYKNEIV